MMRILHVYDDSDITSAHYVAMLTKAIGDRAEMFNATNAKDCKAKCSELHPDILHLHAQPTFELPPDYRLVVTPHGHELGPINAFVFIARSQMERNRLAERFSRIETVRNPLITRTITPEMCATSMMAVYQRVMDSSVPELMNSATRQSLPILLAAAIGGDRRWVDPNSLESLLPQANFRQLYIYAEHEGVLPHVEKALRLLGISAPSYEPVSCYMPSEFHQPKALSGSGIVTMLEDISQNGPSLLRLVEIAEALRADTLDESELLERLEEENLQPFFASVLQLLAEQCLLTEGFMPCPPVNNRETQELRTLLFNRQKI